MDPPPAFDVGEAVYWKLKSASLGLQAAPDLLEADEAEEAVLGMPEAAEAEEAEPGLWEAGGSEGAVEAGSGSSSGYVTASSGYATAEEETEESEAAQAPVRQVKTQEENQSSKLDAKVCCH